MLLFVAVRYSVVQCVAAYCLQTSVMYTIRRTHHLRVPTVCSNVLQCIAACCSALHRDIHKSHMGLLRLEGSPKL